MEVSTVTGGMRRGPYLISSAEEFRGKEEPSADLG